MINRDPGAAMEPDYRRRLNGRAAAASARAESERAEQARVATEKRAEKVKTATDLAAASSRMINALVIFALFCILTALSPDERLLENTANVTIPIVDVSVPFWLFLAAAPLILLGLALSVAFSIIHLDTLLSADGTIRSELPLTIVTSRAKTAVLLRGAIFHLTVPATLAVITFKALALPYYAVAILVAMVPLSWGVSRRYLQSPRVPRWTLDVAAAAVWLVVAAIIWRPPVEIRRPFHLEAANLQGAALKDLDLRDANMTGANLTGADLSGKVKLTNARLAGAVLNGANLSGVDGRSADFSGASLIGANLTGGSKLDGAYLSGTVLTNANLVGIHAKGADFTAASLTGANLSGGSNLVGAHLSSAVLTNANLSKVTATKADFSGASLLGANLSDAHAEHAVFVGADLTATRIAHAHFDFANFHGAVLDFADGEPGASTPGEELPATTATQPTDPSDPLTPADGPTFIAADFSSASLRGARLTGADFFLATFPHTDMRLGLFDEAKFSGALLKEADLSGSSFKRARFDGADVSYAMLTAVTFENGFFTYALLGNDRTDAVAADEVDFLKDMVKPYRSRRLWIAPALESLQRSGLAPFAKIGGAEKSIGCAKDDQICASIATDKLAGDTDLSLGFRWSNDRFATIADQICAYNDPALIDELLTYGTQTARGVEGRYLAAAAKTAVCYDIVSPATKSSLEKTARVLGQSQIDSAAPAPNSSNNVRQVSDHEKQ